MRIITHYLIIMIILTACNGIKHTPKPDPFIKPDQMVLVITDIHLMQGAINTNQRDFAKLGIHPQTYLYHKYGIDSLDYKRNFDYYTDRPDDYIEILNKVEQRLNTIKDSIAIKKQLRQESAHELDTTILNTIKNKPLDTLKRQLREVK